MNRIRGWVCGMLLFGLCAAIAAEPARRVQVISEPAHLFDDAWGRMGKPLDKGTELELVGEKDESYRVKVLISGEWREAFINKEVVRLVDAPAVVPDPPRVHQPAPARGPQPEEEEPEVKKDRTWWYVGGGVLLAGGAAAALAGGGGGGDDGDSSSSDSSSSSGGGSSVKGTWNGKAATGQVSTTLKLNQSGSSISGTLYWPKGDTRNVSGSISGSSVKLNIEKGDVWHLTLSGNRLSGYGDKYGGGSYNVSLNR